MIITFCGHSDFVATEEYERRVFAIFEEKIGDSHAIFYLGGYGAFDSFAYRCCMQYKNSHPSARVALITPYLDGKHKKGFFEGGEYDEIIYPELENVPPRFAISRRNEWTVERADIVVAFVERSVGGAYKTLKHAEKKGSAIINLAEKDKK